MTFLDVGVQVFALAASTGLDEVLPVAAALSASRPRLLFLAQEGPVRVLIIDRNITFRAVEDVAYTVAIKFAPAVGPMPDAGLIVRHPVADFKDDQHLLTVLGEFEVVHLCVRRNLIVVANKIDA